MKFSEVRAIAAVAVLVAGCLLAAPVWAADPIPLATFVGNPDIGDVKLSPSGKHVALTVAGKSGRVLLAVAGADALDSPTVIASSPRADIRSFEWVNDDWLVFNAVDLQAPAADQDFGPGLFSVHRDGSRQRQLIQVRYDFVSGAATSPQLLDWRHFFMQVLRDGSSDVIVGHVQYDNLWEVSSVTPRRLDVSTGRSTIAALGYPERTTSWVFDASGVARVASGGNDGWIETFWRDGEKTPWRSIQRERELSPDLINPLAVDSSGRLYVATESSGGTSVIKRFDFATGKPEKDALASAPGFDLEDGLIFSGDQRRLLGLRVVTDAETTVWFEPERKRLQELADARFPGRINRTQCAACEGDGTMLVYSYSDRDPGVWSAYRPKTQAWLTLGSVVRGIDPRLMAELDLHRVRARDGLELPVWVTKPRGAKGPLPAVLLVHGGPWVRGVRWRWDGEAQFLASRGYAVIEPEFRGSTGYGSKLFRAGWKNWGTTMQDDLADAVRWAADQGIVDAKRVCIAGGSYGGYAALMAPIRYPELFKCSAAFVAVSDPRLLFEESWQNDIGRRAHFSMRVLIGDPLKDAVMLKAASPLERAAELKIPVFMAYGSDDLRVPLEHGSRMRAAMRAAGQNPEYVVYTSEGHGFLKPENRFDFYARLEKFFFKHIGGN